jgi:GNAT superfamily N-acetyltransferase
VTVRIEEFDPKTDAELLRACFEMTQAGWPIDHPDEPPWSFGAFAGKWGPGFEGAPRRAWLASDAGEPVGAYLLRLPDRENVTTAHCWVIVAPGSRRRGIGTALVAHCADQARQAGRSRLTSNVRDDTPGATFAAAAGARGGIPEVVRMLTIDDEMPARLARLRSAAEPFGRDYSVLSWLGATPAEHIDQVAAVHAAMADAPRNDGKEPWAWTADRVRQSEQTIIDHELALYSVAARHDATGDFAALTQVCTEADNPDWAFQQVTAVLPKHRGHRLGLLVKIAMLDLLAVHEPAVRRIETSNAGANAHMIAINEQLGFTACGVSRDWELDLLALAAQASA